MSRRVRVQPNMLDSLISYVDPIAGARRLHARALMAIAGGYLGGRRDRRATKEWRLTGNSADADLVPDLALLRDRSRDLVRNAPLATGAIVTVVQNVIAGGLVLQARPDWKFLRMSEDEADQWTETVEREFNLWAESKDADLTRVQNFYELQGLVFRSTLESGDTLVLTPMVQRPMTPYLTTLQIIEGDRLETPRGLREQGKTKAGNLISGGVELDSNGAAIAYHILRAHPGSWNGRRTQSDRFATFGEDGRRNVIHIFERTRPGMNRGAPYLAPVIELLKQLDKYTEAEVTAAVLSSLITAFVQSTGDGLMSPAGTTTASEDEKEIKLGSGSIVDLAPGETISSFAPNRPNNAFESFLQSVLRQIGVALGLPFEVLIKHFTASYSASRAALLESWRFFQGRREFLCTQFCRPVYEVWMEEAVARGRVEAPGFFDDASVRRAYLLSEWIGSGPIQIDPVKEVDAAGKRLELRLSTREDETLMLTGKDWSDVQRRLAREQQLLDRDGLATARETPPPSEPPGPARENEGPAEPTEDEPETGDLELPEKGDLEEVGTFT